MDRQEFIINFWRDVAAQNAEALKMYFCANALVCWHNTNEQFSVDEYIVANCEYPGDWQGEVECIEYADKVTISVTRVWLSDNSASFRVTSFFEFDNNKISRLNEYWGEEVTAPQWRLDKHIGKPMK